jgi:hypothetical protein
MQSRRRRRLLRTRARRRADVSSPLSGRAQSGRSLASRWSSTQRRSPGPAAAAGAFHRHRPHATMPQGRAPAPEERCISPFLPPRFPLSRAHLAKLPASRQRRARLEFTAHGLRTRRRLHCHSPIAHAIYTAAAGVQLYLSVAFPLDAETRLFDRTQQTLCERT